MNIRMLTRTAFASLLLALGTFAIPTPSAQAQDYAALIAAPDRSDADRQNDKKRDPVKLLTFSGPKTGWTVYDMGAGGGYSTELMARSVGPTGKVYGQNDKVSERMAARLKTPAMANVVSVTRGYDEPIAPEARNVDLITFFFAYHDVTFMEVDRAKMNKAMFDALKSGGMLVIADHSAKPEDGTSVGKTLHRISEAALRKEVEAAGFKFVASADFLRHPEDERTAVVFRNPTPVDEFVLKFQKP